MPTFALTTVPTEALKTALTQVHRGEWRYPLTPVEVARVGLQNHADALLGHLRGLDGPAVRAVLTAVLAERLQRR
jgi:hypothetical protein